MPIYKYYIQGQEFSPINRGDYTHDYNLEEESGFYQFVYSLSGAVSFGADAYSFITSHGDCQKLTFVITEKSSIGEFNLFNGYFNNRDCKFYPIEKRIDVTPKEDTIYDCIKKSIDVKFNFLELGKVTSVIYDNTPKFEFKVILWTPSDIPDLPFYGSYVQTAIGGSPFLGFAVYVREILTTYCVGGELQAPIGANWELLLDECSSKNIATWFRKPDVFQDPTSFVASTDFAETNAILPAQPPVPPVTNNQDWVLMDTIIQGIGIRGFWIDYNVIKGDQIEIPNGRKLVDVLNYGLNEIDCEEVDIQSLFLTDEFNPVTLESPSSTQGIEMYSISDVKSPDADIKATIENVTLKDLFEGYLQGKLNCRLRADNNTKRLIIEHVSQLVGVQTYDITNSQRLKREFEFDNSDIPTAEEFPSLDQSIDFTGVDIRFINNCADGVKAYTTDKFYSEVVAIIDNSEEYPNDGILMVTPDSLAPQASGEIGSRSENGYLTGDFRPNAPQAMANLHNKFWKYWRPFPIGIINFEQTNFLQNKPVKVLETINVPLCELGGSFFRFDPYAFFKGLDFNNGYLQSASYNESTKEVELTIKYYE